MCDAGLIDGAQWQSAGTNQQGGAGGVPLPDGSRKEYYDNGVDGKADWNRRPTWKEFCEAFAKVATLDGDEKHKTAYATMSRMRSLLTRKP